MMQSLEERLIALEVSVMELTQMTEDLSSELVRHAKELERLSVQNKSLKEAIEAGGIVKSQSEETPPPHY